MSDPAQDPPDRPATGQPAGTRFTFTCPNCGNGFAVTFPPGVPVPESADALCTVCRAARDAKPEA